MRGLSPVIMLAGVSFAAVAWAPRAGADASAPSAAAPGPVVIATVDDEPVTTRDLRVLLARQEPPRNAAAAAAITADGLVQRLIENRLLEQEGYRQGLDRDPEVQAQVRDVVHHQAMMALLDSVSAQVPDPEPMPTVDAAPLTSRMFHVSHILVKTEAEARALRDSLAAGTPFPDLARRRSLDELSAPSGGELGWAREDKFIPEFAAALKDLPEGEVTGPVQTADGYHLLWLSEVRTETLPQGGAMAEVARQAEKRHRVMEVVRAYVDSLRVKYGVVQNDSLLASLDYGSEDPQVLRELRASPQVLAKLPWRDFTVAQFTGRLLFEHFHGLAGQADASQIRDRSFDEWITEALLRHEAVELGLDRKPEIVAAGDEMEREQMREAMGRRILDIRFDPTPDEVRRYYEENREAFTPPPRVRADGVLLSSEETARTFRQRLDAGAQLGWLADRTKDVVDRDPAMFSGWLTPEQLGASGERLRVGQLVGPFDAGGRWAVARVSDTEDVAPLPLEKCRAQVLARLKAERQHDAMTASVAKLRKAAAIEVAEGARQTVQRAIDQWMGAGKDGTP
jgi:peptidyl-prolyl cis-trans isomerase C